MGNGTTLTRYDIFDLNANKVPEFPTLDGQSPGWDPISLYYAKALQRMGWNESGQGPYPDAPQSSDPNDPYPGTPNPANTWNFDLENPDPTAYFFWGAMHWWPGNDWEYWNENAPSPQDEYWSHCTHGPAQTEKYFLPWHRLYIYFYEVMVRAKVAEIPGGPENWALPYWNYSGNWSGNFSTPWPKARLPWVFCQPNLPDDGSLNPLYLDVTRRGLQPEWPSGSQKGQPMYLGRMTPYYYQAYAIRTLFEAPDDSTGFNVTLDYTVHGGVHNDTGNGLGISNTGWMQNTQSAGFDPIFWMHHSEIDRFWVQWNAEGGLNPDKQPNPDPNWASASDDPTKTRWNFWASGNIEDVLVYHPGDMTDPANLDSRFPYSYEFANMPQYPAPRPPAVSLRATAAPQVESLLARDAAPAEAVTPDGPPPAQAREVGAADQPLEIGKEPATARVSLPEPPPSFRAFEAEDEESPRVTLRLDGVKAQGPTGNYEVYLNNTDVDRSTEGEVPHFVGLLSAFGTNHSHGGHLHGISATFDITDVVAYLRSQGEWDESDVNVTFVPVYRDVEGVEPAIGQVTVDKVSIHTD